MLDKNWPEFANTASISKKRKPESSDSNTTVSDEEEAKTEKPHKHKHKKPRHTKTPKQEEHKPSDQKFFFSDAKVKRASNASKSTSASYKSNNSMMMDETQEH